MINSFGVHWNTDLVFWGWQNNKGKLLGAVSRSDKSASIEFNDIRGIYALYAEYDLVYVGQAGGGKKDRLFERLRVHRSDHLAERWNRFSWFGTQRVTKQNRLSIDTVKAGDKIPNVLNLIEAVTIAVSEPRLNLQRGRWGNSKQYFQVAACDDGGVE